jgi:hypothetical protein
VFECGGFRVWGVRVWGLVIGRFRV